MLSPVVGEVENTMEECFPENERMHLTLLWGTWELWCDLPSSNGCNSLESHGSKTSWLDQVKSVGLFDSAEGFWGLYQCTRLPSQLPANTSYFLFRKCIAPMWEHEANRRGGRWVFPIQKISADESGSADEINAIDSAWCSLCLALIGEQFPCSEEEICGLTVSHSRHSSVKSHRSSVSTWRISLWTRSSIEEETQNKIACFIRDLLLDEGILLPTPKSGFLGDAENSASPVKYVFRENPKMAFSLQYIVHRELMQAKLQHTKGKGPSLNKSDQAGSHSDPSSFFKARYVL